MELGTRTEKSGELFISQAKESRHRNTVDISAHGSGVRVDIRMGINIDQAGILAKMILHIDTGGRGGTHDNTVIPAKKQWDLPGFKNRIHILGNALTGSGHGIAVLQYTIRILLHRNLRQFDNS